MQTRTILVGAFAVIFGLVSAVGAFVSQRRAGEAVPTLEVVTSTADLPWGTVIDATHLKLSRFPADAVPEGAVRKIEDAIGRTSRDNLARGELLLAGRLTEPGVGRGLPPLIPKGMRAVSIQTPNVSSGVTGFVMPGNKVDVVLTMHGTGHEDPSGGGRTITLLQNVTVLAVDQNIEAPSENMMDLKQMRTVTLVVTPQQAQELDLGQNKGILRLTLRNPLDDALTEVSQITVSSLTSEHRDLLDSAATSDVTGELAEKTQQTALTPTDAQPTALTLTKTPARKSEPFPVLMIRGNAISPAILVPRNWKAVTEKAQQPASSPDITPAADTSAEAATPSLATLQ
jgi:pilus assembly protein CpaB